MKSIEILKRLGGGSSGGGGGSSGVVNLQDANVVGTTYAQWTISFNGFTYKRRGSGAAVIDLPWISPQIGMSGYQVRATLSDGDEPPGTFDTWLALSSAWTWGWTNQVSQQSCTILMEIRRVSDSVVVDSASIGIFVAGIQ